MRKLTLLLLLALFLSACDDEQERLANQQRDDGRAEHDEEVAEQGEEVGLFGVRGQPELGAGQQRHVKQFA